MADTDTIDVTFTRQKVYHNGECMVVAKDGDTKAVERSLVAGFIAEGVIESPAGWSDEIEGKNALGIADGGVLRPPTGGFPDDVDDLDQLDHDDDGEPGGSREHEPPSLGGKNKAELLAIADDEGVEVPNGATNAQIAEAIEASRADEEQAPAA